MTETSRPTRPTIDQIRQVCQPPEVRSRRSAEHWVADLYLRRWSPYLTRVLLRTPISPNGVTGIMIATGAATAFALLIPGMPGVLMAACLGQLQMLWDCCDGEVARWQQRFSASGVFLDQVGHFTAEGLIPIALGIRASGWPGEPILGSPWPLVGLVLSVLVLFNKSLNEMVHAARSASGMDRLDDSAEIAAPRATGPRKLRQLTRYFPFQRAYHSVELTIIALAAGTLDALAGNLAPTRFALAALAVLAVPAVVGHVMAILTSSRLR
ncbi:MAG: CDP-alcohol phosphatidyltransferase family protein [Candidatus Nanopelagicales bacterium]|nr:CDP-alcohol phosphatidyltransferase family protein [Candidatus Nanopelagicales bacterium]